MTEFDRFLSAAELAHKLSQAITVREMNSLLRLNPNADFAELEGGARAEALQAVVRMAYIGDVKGIGALLAAGAPVNAATPQDYPPLCAAAEHVQPEAVALLLEAGADPNGRCGSKLPDRDLCQEDYTPLMMAVVAVQARAFVVREDLPRLVATLLQAGADPLCACGEPPVLPVTHLARVVKARAAQDWLPGEEQRVEESAALLLKATFEPQRWLGKREAEALAIVAELPEAWHKHVQSSELVRYFRSQQPKGKAPFARKASPTGGPGTV